MKNKLSKLLATFMLLITITATIPCIAHAESGFELIESSDGNTLVVHNENPGELSKTLNDRYKFGSYEHIKVIGKMNDHDFVTLLLSSFNCKSIDLYEVDANSIPHDVFCCSYDLEKFVCPHNLETIEKGNFTSCIGLKTVVLPKTLKSIEKCCFMYCNNLELTVPESVEIGNCTFCNCPNVSCVIKESALGPEQPSDDLKNGQTRCKSLIYYIISLFK